MTAFEKTEKLRKELRKLYGKVECKDSRLYMYDKPGTFGFDFDPVIRIFADLGVWYSTMDMRTENSLEEGYGCLGIVGVSGIYNFLQEDGEM
jgi:hypothetical protein